MRSLRPMPSSSIAAAEVVRAGKHVRRRVRAGRQSSSMSRKRAPGICAARYSSRPLRPLAGMCQLASTTTRSGSPRCCAAIRSRRARPCAEDRLARAATASWPRDGNDPPRQASAAARLSGRGGARLCAQSAARRALPGALHGAGVHVAVPGDRPARLRPSGDRLCARRDDRREQEPEAVPRRLPQPLRLPRGRDGRHRPAAGRTR